MTDEQLAVLGLDAYWTKGSVETAWLRAARAIREAVEGDKNAQIAALEAERDALKSKCGRCGCSGEKAESTAYCPECLAWYREEWGQHSPCAKEAVLQAELDQALAERDGLAAALKMATDALVGIDAGRGGCEEEWCWRKAEETCLSLPPKAQIDAILAAHDAALTAPLQARVEELEGALEKARRAWILSYGMWRLYVNNVFLGIVYNHGGNLPWHWEADGRGNNCATEAEAKAAVEAALAGKGGAE